MSTLVISDLHLGNRGGRDILRLAPVRARLLAALDDVERLVLLGDCIELVKRRPGRSLALAEPVLGEIGRALGPDREVILVPGNHDGPLVREWALAQGTALTAAHDVDPDASPALARVLSWLRPARVRASYPGVWLGDGVWATHGHYLDHHLFPTSAYGALRPRDRPALPPGGPAGYELAAVRHHEAHRQGSEHHDARRLVRRAALTGLKTLTSRAPELLWRTGMAPVTARLIDTQMRHVAVPAMERVTERLGVKADVIVFGHVHRRGPIGDESWPHPGGTRFLNTGSWLREPLLIDRAAPPHPYWPGGAVLIDRAGIPRSIGLLDDVAAEELRPPGRH